MTALAATVVLASFAGSLHCAGMCGPLVALVQGGNTTRLHLAYQAGRLGAYALLGFAAGLIGHGVDTVAAARGLENAALGLAGAALAITAIARLAAPRTTHSSGIARALAMRALAQGQPTLRATLFGAATGLLPCGWLYAWLPVAAAAGSPAAGALVMVCFGLGAVPALAAGNALLGRITTLVRFRAPRVAPLLLVAAGFVALVTRGPVVVSIHRALERVPGAQSGSSVCHGG